MKRNKIYIQITDAILEKLKEGTVPWRKPWLEGLPQNYISRRIYNGINFLSLLTKDFPSPYYLTYLQCKRKGGSVLPGAKGLPIIYFSVKEKTVDTKDATKVERIPLFRISHVFNLSQTTLYKDESPKLKLPSCESVLSKIQAEHDIDIRENPYRCFYSVTEDYISLPRIADFESGAEEWYSSLFHELIHWTGNQSRLNRISSVQELETLSLEEMTAELGSAFLSGMSGIQNAVLENQGSYINGWYRKIEADPEILITAASKAFHAVEFLLGKGEFLS